MKLGPRRNYHEGCLNSVLNVKAVVAAFNQEKALVGAFFVITNLRMELFGALVMCCLGGVGNYKLHGLTSKKGFYHLCLLPFPSAARKTVKQRGTYTMYQTGSLLLHCLDILINWSRQKHSTNINISQSFIALFKLFLKNNKCDGFSIYLGIDQI